ncbi:MAG: 5'-nucleotidase [Christensenella sp.]|uniref:5'-nucleotidase n=1 Tax=Christensenella sp. TaxID=1935934 RepID=UPI002B1EA399|nr:5'-nucleotidase [Christensenella sp.]MEA5004099.1 5'-nucleotidase [Christensenella sp.]
MLDGSMTREQAVALIDEQNRYPEVSEDDEVIGNASTDFTLIETGNFLTDAMREKAGTEIALFLDNGKDGRNNGKGVSGKIYEGEQTEADILRIFPDLRREEKGELQKVTMTGQKLLDTLEYAIPVDNDSRGWFYYFSGLRMEFAPAAEPGSRIKKITDAQGNDIDLNKVYSVAVMDASVPEDAVISCEDTGLSIKDIWTEKIKILGTISPGGDGRFLAVDP